ncbi:MAG: DUF29 domain-containing protein [Leptolyngbyaceae cyanobacterium SL_7_1]|nr:DUF29 domain-containing protein [Leptolyngbyaceae cyanobacterium SL_7_1]
MSEATLYNQDFLKWTEQQVECLQKSRWAELDVENLVEELESLGRSEQRELGSYLQVLMMHLLKGQYQPERNTQSWRVTIANCRNKIQDCLEDTPSLRRFLQDLEWIEKYYRRARRDAANETQQPLERFPIACPYPIEQLLDPNYSTVIGEDS